MSVKGRALLLCPVPSNVDLLRYGEGIAHINAENAQQMPRTHSADSRCRLEEHASCKAMSAFTVAIRGKADMCFCAAHVCF